MISAIIVAAGKGTRMGPNQDKLFLEIAGLPIVGHTWKRFDQAPMIDEIILVIREELHAAFNELAVQIGSQKPFRLVAGGKERQDSVWNGLQAVAKDSEVVLIQDGARPCTALEVIEQTILEAREHGAAVAAQPVVDTIKESSDGLHVARHLDRKTLWAVQTPQTFRTALILKALKEVREKGLLITDDTAACELVGQAVRLVSSTQPNPKITIPSDLPYFELLLRRNGG